MNSNPKTHGREALADPGDPSVGKTGAKDGWMGGFVLVADRRQSSLNRNSDI